VTTLPIDSPRDVETAFGSVWVSNGPAATVTRIDPATQATIATITVPDPASVLGPGKTAMWLTSYPANSLTRIDPVTNKATKTVSLASVGSGPIGITEAAGFVWVANHDGTPVTSLAKVDPSTMAIVDVIPVGQGTDSGPNWLSFAAGSIWVDVPNLNAVVRIDPKTDKLIATIPVTAACGALVATDTVVWVAGGGGDGCQGVIERIDARTNQLQATIRLPSDVNPLAIGPDGVWFGTSGAVGRVDPASNTVTGLVTVPGTPFGEAIGFGSVWLTDPDNGALYVVRPN
jgi:virginiamycin B lyase